MDLTPEQAKIIGDRLGDILHWDGDDIALSLGIPSRAERDWTDAESDRIWSEIELLHKPFFIDQLLAP